MNKEVLDFQVYNGICEAVGCYAKATDDIIINVGILGAISLSLCSDCMSRFQEAPQQQ